MKYREASMQITKKISISLLEMLVILAIIAILTVLLLSPVQVGRTSAKREFFRSQMKQIGLALYHYQEDHGCLPPPVVRDEQGAPLHSWRALLLPYLQSAPHLKGRRLDYRFNEHWNSPHNQQFAAQNRDLFQLDWQPQQGPRQKSRLVAVIDDSTWWNETQECHVLSDAADRAQHILLIEIPSAEPTWNKPVDITLDELLEWSQNGLFDAYGPLAVFVDGHIEWLSSAELRGNRLRNKLQRAEVNQTN